MSATLFRRRVGQLIRSARKTRGWTQDELADAIGETVTKSLVSRYETGSVLPRIERLEEILKLCGVPVIPPLIKAGYRDTAVEKPNTYGQVFATESAKEFIELWLRYPKIDDVADALGMSRKQVQWYATRLRKKGVDLPRAARKERDSPEDIEELKSFLHDKLAKRAETPLPSEAPEES